MQKVLKTIPFTPKKYKEMQQKVIELSAEREQVMQRLVEARAMGDLSENGAYKYAKFELGNVSRELRRYKQLLLQGFPAPKQATPKGLIDFGSTVTVEKLDETKKQKTFLIVSEHESDPSKGKISYKSPIGKALLRKKVGEKVSVQTPIGETKFIIINIS